MGITVINKATGEAYTGGRGAATPAVSAGEQKTGGKQEYKSGGVTLTVTEQVEKRQNSYVPARKNQESEAPSLTDRLVSILAGAGKSYAADLGAAAGAAVQAGQYNTTRELRTQYEAQRRRYEQMLADNEATPGKWSDRVLEGIRTDMERTAGMLESGQKAIAESGLVKGATQLRESSGALRTSGQEDIERGKQGMGAAGQFLVDVGVAGGQLAADMGANLLLPGAGMALMGARAFGSEADAAQAKGATLDQQVMAGLGSAAISMAVEKIANVAKPFRKAFGAGVLDDAITKATGKLSQSAAGKIALSALAEGGEEFVEAVLQPVLQRATYDPEASFDLGEALYQAAIGAVLGGVGGGVDAATSRKVGGTPQNTPPNPTAQRTAQGEVVDTTRSESPVEVPTDPLAQALFGRGESAAAVPVAPAQVSSPAAERSMPEARSAVLRIALQSARANGRPSAREVSDVASSIEALEELGVDFRGKTASQRREAVRTAIEQIVAADISTSADVETQNSFDAAAQAAYTGIERSAFSQGIADKYGVVLDEAGRGRNKTGKRSAQAQSVIDRAARGEEISLEELNAIPEVAMALEEVHNGVETCTLPNREKIVQDGIRRALERGSYSGKGPDGKDTFNGEVRRNRRIDIVTGVAGSGKSSVYSNRISGEQGSRIIDTDDYRDYIPEYNGRNAALVHEEASAIKKGVLAQALTDGENILLSVVGDNAERLAREILSFRRAGYEVHLHLNHLPN